MLQVFRDHAHKWFVKLLFWLLVLSFGMWGIADIVFKFFNDRPVVKVGKHTISQEELAHHLQKENARIQEITKGKITAQELRALGVHTAVIDKLVNHYVITDELENMNLGTSDEALKDQIYNMPVFKTDGIFDSNKFLSALNQQGLTEAKFIKEARFSLLSQQFLASVSSGAILLDAYKNLLIDSLTTENIFTLVEIDASNLPLTEKASLEQLQSYYDQYKNRYMVPELRSITVITLDTKALIKLFGITDDQLEKAYQAQKNNYKYPERRMVGYLAYSQEDKAQQALEMIKKNVPLKKIETEIPGGEYQEVGLIAKEQLPAYAAEQVFGLKEGQSTNIIETGAGFIIFTVSKIEQPRTASFDEVKVLVEASVIQEHKSGKLEEIRGQIDDAIASGQSLSDVGAQMKLTVHTFENINARGQNTEGKPIFEKPTAMNKGIIEKAFSTEQGLDSGFVDIPGEGAFILSVNKVAPSHDPKFSDIEKKVREDWEFEQKQEAASKLASSIVSEAKSLGALVNLSNKHNLTLSTNYSLSKLDIGKSNRKMADLFPAKLAEKAFTLAPEKATFGANEKEGYTVVMLQKIGGKKATDKERQELLATMARMIQEDISSATINALKEQHKVEINQQMLSQMME